MYKITILNTTVQYPLISIFSLPATTAQPPFPPSSLSETGEWHHVYLQTYRHGQYAVALA